MFVFMCFVKDCVECFNCILVLQLHKTFCFQSKRSRVEASGVLVCFPWRLKSNQVQISLYFSDDLGTWKIIPLKRCVHLLLCLCQNQFEPFFLVHLLASCIFFLCQWNLPCTIASESFDQYSVTASETFPIRLQIFSFVCIFILFLYQAALLLLYFLLSPQSFSNKLLSRSSTLVIWPTTPTVSIQTNIYSLTGWQMQQHFLVIQQLVRVWMLVEKTFPCWI